MSTYSGFLASSAPASRNRFERKRDALPAADAEGDHAALQAVAAHRVDEAGREHGARGADRVAMRDGAALDIDDVGREAELARHGDDGGGAVDARRIAGGDGPVGAEGRLERCQRFARRAGPVVLVLVEDGRALAAGEFDRQDLVLELARGLGRAEALLRAQRPLVLRLARDLELGGEVFRVPARSLVREGVVEAVAQHAVVELSVAHAVAPAPARSEEH